eukprot:3059540-Rhodomonas_salina.1
MTECTLRARSAKRQTWSVFACGLDALCLWLECPRHPTLSEHDVDARMRGCEDGRVMDAPSSTRRRCGCRDAHVAVGVRMWIVCSCARGFSWCETCRACVRV